MGGENANTQMPVCAHRTLLGYRNKTSFDLQRQMRGCKADRRSPLQPANHCIWQQSNPERDFPQRLRKIHKHSFGEEKGKTDSKAPSTGGLPDGHRGRSHTAEQSLNKESCQEHLEGQTRSGPTSGQSGLRHCRAPGNEPRTLASGRKSRVPAGTPSEDSPDLPRCSRAHQHSERGGGAEIWS